MADIELVIKIPEESYKAICYRQILRLDVENVVQGVKTGIPLPKGHGKIVDIGKIDKDRIEKDNPIIYLTVNGEYVEAVSLDYLNGLPAIIEADKESEG